MALGCPNGSSGNGQATRLRIDRPDLLISDFDPQRCANPSFELAHKFQQIIKETLTALIVVRDEPEERTEYADRLAQLEEQMRAAMQTLSLAWSGGACQPVSGEGLDTRFWFQLFSLLNAYSNGSRPIDYLAVCPNCFNPFIKSRKDKRFCTDKCRNLFALEGLHEPQGLPV